ncbi:MAG: hypothetical protein R2727_08735 [Bacteroidales bacterium]
MLKAGAGLGTISGLIKIFEVSFFSPVEQHVNITRTRDASIERVVLFFHFSFVL